MNFLPEFRYHFTAVFFLWAAASPALCAEQTLPLPYSSSLPYIEEIIVSGDFRGRSTHSVPTSITAFDSHEVTRRGARHLEELLAVTPNLQMASGASRARFYHIRGIGERSQYTNPAHNSVGLLIDDVDFSAAGAAATLFDVEQVEVLRGPQGTRYGTGALAGLINIKTQAPTTSVKGYVEQAFANYGSFSTSAAVGGPIKPGRLLYRLAGQKNVSDGFIKNTHLGKQNTNNIDELTLRAKLRWFLYEALRIDLHFSHIDVDNGYDAFSLDNNRNTLADQPARDHQDSWHGGVNLRWDLNQATFTGLVNFSHANIDYGFDEDWVFPGFHADGYTSTDRLKRIRKTASLETRLVSRPEGAIGGHTDWLLGFYAFDKEVDLARSHTFTGAFRSDYDTRQLAFYAELDSAIHPSVVLSLGARIESWQADYADSINAASNSRETLWGGRLSLNYQPTEQAFWYLSLARGYKAGGFNPNNDLAAALRQFDSEKLYNLEVGVKRQWLAGRLSGTAALFYMDRDTPQVATSLAVQSKGMAPEQFIELIANAAEGFNSGLELSLSFRPNPNWQFSGQLGLLRAEYDRVNTLAQAADGRLTAVENESLSGRDQAQAPDWQYALAIERHFSNWSLHFEHTAGDGYYFSDSHNQRLRSRRLSHVKLSYTKNDWNFTAWMRNIANANVEVHGFYFGNDPRNGYADRVYTQLGEPRRIGLSARFHFDKSN